MKTMVYEGWWNEGLMEVGTKPLTVEVGSERWQWQWLDLRATMVVVVRFEGEDGNGGGET
ncbi:hypothetical protein MTR_1g050370 [Medicago truncatula]|uniref:Uncharacterized protein n=1 Tax=Medicago truncatula TaxID=3880 RepID=G7I7B5_MEDTR|nr:hypothetical protein MTR_1g050370 [Medicago truncatula]